MSSELDEEVMHLTQVSGIAMGVQEGKPRKRVFPEGGNDPVPTLRFKDVNVDVFIGGDAGEHRRAVLLPVNVVGGWLWREKREFRSHCSCDIAHLHTTHKPRFWFVQHEPKR